MHLIFLLRGIYLLIFEGIFIVFDNKKERKQDVTPITLAGKCLTVELKKWTQQMNSNF